MNSEIIDFQDDEIYSEDKLVHFIIGQEGYIPLNTPKFSKELECEFCDCTSFIVIPDQDKNIGFCKNVCEGSRAKKSVQATLTSANNKRVLLWPSFCEINDIGDQYYDVSFEKIKQPEVRVKYFLKFAIAPKGIILLEGSPGTGKTYAAMAICEYFTRKSPHCIFTTQKKMSYNWTNSLTEPMNNYINSLKSTHLLVIDDFATGEPNSKFLEFFMEVINTRIQWSNRGTVITTNLKTKEFNTYCGEALVDRITTGQKFIFVGESRRKPIIL